MDHGEFILSLLLFLGLLAVDGVLRLLSSLDKLCLNIDVVLRRAALGDALLQS